MRRGGSACRGFYKRCTPFDTLHAENLQLNLYFIMNQKRQLKRRAREAQQARQANRVINGIFVALVLLGILALLAYWLLV